jgi:16S rRNA (uracil1498-N3)-methyltransferase
VRTPFVLTGHDLAGLDAGAVVTLGEDRVHHLRRVLRRDDGAELELTDGHGRLVTAELVGQAARLTAAPRAVAPPVPAVTVHHAVPKGRALDEIVRTLAELGVAEVRPVITDHTESRPTGDRARSVGDRLRAVAESALQQAQSAHLCLVADPAPLDVTLRDGTGGATALAAHPAAVTTLGAHMATVEAEVPIHLLVGPEGGLSDRELEALTDSGWTAVSAGATVLRTVHAATVLTAAVLAFSGRFGGEVG